MFSIYLTKISKYFIQTKLKKNMRMVMTESQYNFSKGWRLKDGKLNKKFNFNTYESSIKFLNRVINLSKTNNIIPEIIFKEKSVEIVIFNIKDDKVSDQCHKLANLINSI
jgi:pterin-4a-carbinolamine dehydratase